MKFKLIFLLLIVSNHLKAQLENEKNFDYHKPLFDFDKNKSTLLLQNEQLENEFRNLRFVVVTGYREGVKSTLGLGNNDVSVDRKHGTARLYMYNLSIEQMLTGGFYKTNHVILDVANPLHYRYDPSKGSKLEWMRSNAYCFEYTIPFGTMKSQKQINDELGHFFGVQFGLEKRLVSVLLLIRTSQQDKIRSAGKGDGIYDMKGYFNNVPLDRILDPLNQEELPPVIDETHYKFNVDLDLNINSWKDLEEVRRALKKYDLDLKLEKRQFEMFVIKELNKK